MNNTTSIKERAMQQIAQLRESENNGASPLQTLQDAIAYLETIAPEIRHDIICNGVLKLKSVAGLIQTNPDLARGLMADMTKLLPADTPVFTSDDVSAHKRENYDSVFTLVIFFNQNADQGTRQACVYMACKKGWSAQRLAHHWAKNPLGEDHKWESHKRRIMLPYFINAFADVANDDARADSTRLAAIEALEQMQEKIGRLRPDLFESLDIKAMN